MRARLKKNGRSRGSAPRGGGSGGPLHLPMVVILVGILIHSNSSGRRSSSISSRRRYSKNYCWVEVGLNLHSNLGSNLLLLLLLLLLRLLLL